MTGVQTCALPILSAIKYAAYRLKPDDSRVIRLDDEYFVVSSMLYLMIRRYLVALRKGDDSAETLFHL